MGATKKRERFLVVHARREPHITHEGGGSEGNKRGEGNGIVFSSTVRSTRRPPALCSPERSCRLLLSIAVVAALFPVLLSRGWEGRRRKDRYGLPSSERLPSPSPVGERGGIGGELRKLLSLSLSPWVGRGRLAAAEREREERFFKRAGDVGAAVWLCPALEAGRDGQGSFGGSRFVLKNYGDISPNGIAVRKVSDLFLC